MLNSAENFSNLKQTLVAGKKIDLLKVDPPLSPVVILGFDDATRIQSKFELIIAIEFNDIISELNTRLEEHKEKAKKCIDGSKQVTKKE